MTHSDLRIRPAAQSDRAALIALVNSAFAIETFLEGTRTDEERFSAAMRVAEVFVAEEAGGKPLGCISAEVRGERGYLGMLAVDPARQGSGIASLLVRAAEDHLRRQGCRSVEISVLSLRPELLPLYRRFGFVETGTAPFTYPRTFRGNVACHCIVMSKPL